MQSYLRKNYAEESFRLKKTCKKCSNSKTENCHRGWHRGVRVSWFNKFKTQAELRGISFELTIEEVADIYEMQNGMCAMTGWPIEFPEIGHPQNTDASIDRIDSNEGYSKSNIQIVHKMINMMKQSFSKKDFVRACIAVSDKTKW